MLKRVKEYFKGEDSSLQIDNTGQTTEQDLVVAVAVLLLEMAGQDEDYAPEETKTIFRALQEQFNIDQEYALELLEIADSMRENAGGAIDGFIEKVNQHFTARQRQTVLAMIWKIVFADGEVDKFEIKFAHQMKYRLKLSDEQADQAKQFAQTGEV